MKTDITYLGNVINVNSNSIEVEISKEIPSAAPIIGGKLYKIGQIGTFVKIPVGNLILFGIVSSVSNTPTSVENVTYEPNYGSRFLQVQLIGEKLGEKKFEKGIGTYPTINDEVHLVTEDDLRIIYGEREDGYIEIGKHSSSENLSVYVDLHNFILRHSAILGSTGSGKSNTTVCVIKSILNDYPGARVVLVDTHGEYAAAFKDKAKVVKINDSENPLFIPFWAMNFDELSFFLVGRKEGQELTPDKRLREKIVELKNKNCGKLISGKVKEEFITADSPIPFDIHLMWYDFNRELVATFREGQEDKQTTETEMLIKEGDSKKFNTCRIPAI